MTQLNTISERLDRYVTVGLKSVTGWFQAQSAEVIASLLERQVADDVRGNVAEIGVHHGKSFLLLANGVRDDERAVALDVFGDQDLNVDRSGHGDLEKFEANLAQWADPALVDIHQTTSTAVTPEGAVDTFGRVRLFSIDGGHTAAITANDLRLAEACLVENGVVVLDDIFNPQWLGVITGLRDYLAENGVLQPFATSANKLYLAHPAAVSTYVQHLRTALPDLLGKKDVEFFGTVIDIYGGASAPRTRAWNKAQASGAHASQTETALQETQRELERARARVRDLESSTSWRVTAPVRAVVSLVRRKRAGFGG